MDNELQHFYISNMSLADLDIISQNLETDFDDFWNVNVLKSELESQNSCYFTIKSTSNEILGFGGFWQSVDDVHLTNIVIKKSHRNKGLGSLLLQHIINSARSTGKGSITLEVNENNVYAKKLYLKYGFKILGTRKKYYNNTENAIIMTLNFN